MLDEKDLQAIAALINRTENVLKDDFARMETTLKDDISRVESTLKSDITNVESTLKDDISRVESTLKDDITHTELLLLDEMERYDKKYERRFSELTQEISDLKEVNRMSNNENDTIHTLLRMIENLEKRVSDLENKIA